MTLFEGNFTTEEFSCADGTGLSRNSVTAEVWVNKDNEFEAPALVSASVTLCFILVGVPANLVIITSIMWQHLYRQPTYILLLNLATANFFMCAILMPFTVISGFAGGFKFGSTDVIRCKVCQIGIFYTHFALLTLHILALLSIDRFVFIKYAIKYHKMVTVKRYIVVCCLLWLLCLTVSLFPLFGIGDILFAKQVSACFIRLSSQTKITHNINYAIFLAVEAFVPLSAIVVTNIWILCIIQSQMRKIYSLRRESHHSKVNFRKNIKTKLSKHNKQLKLVKVFGAIWIANIITYIPFLFRVVGSLIFGNKAFNNWWFIVVFVCVISFAVIHPIIEASLCPELRKVFLVLVRKLFCFRKDVCASKINEQELSSFCSGRQYLECLDYCNASILRIAENTELE